MISTWPWRLPMVVWQKWRCCIVCWKHEAVSAGLSGKPGLGAGGASGAVIQPFHFTSGARSFSSLSPLSPPVSPCQSRFLGAVLWPSSDWPWNTWRLPGFCQRNGFLLAFIRATKEEVLLSEYFWFKLSKRSNDLPPRPPPLFGKKALLKRRETPQRHHAVNKEQRGGPCRSSVSTTWIPQHECAQGLGSSPGPWLPLRCASLARPLVSHLFMLDSSYPLNVRGHLFCWLKKFREESGRDSFYNLFQGFLL